MSRAVLKILPQRKFLQACCESVMAVSASVWEIASAMAASSACAVVVEGRVMLLMCFDVEVITAVMAPLLA